MSNVWYEKLFVSKSKNGQLITDLGQDRDLKM